MFMRTGAPIKLFFFESFICIGRYDFLVTLGFNTSTTGDKIFDKKRENQAELNKTRKRWYLLLRRF